MAVLKRQSPVRFGAAAAETEVRDNWTVAMAYSDEGQGPWMVDLSHKARWDLQDGAIAELSPCDLIVPEAPGHCTFAGNTLFNRMNRTQAAIWHLGVQAPDIPAFGGYTDVTESTVFLALFGPHTLYIAEKLTALDITDPSKRAPFLLQGPFCHVPCQIVTLEKNKDMSGGLLMTCSRGYADSMVHAILDAGSEFGLRPAGERRFVDWISTIEAENAANLAKATN